MAAGQQAMQRGQYAEAEAVFAIAVVVAAAVELAVETAGKFAAAVFQIFDGRFEIAIVSAVAIVIVIAIAVAVAPLCRSDRRQSQN